MGMGNDNNLVAQMTASIAIDKKDVLNQILDALNTGQIEMNKKGNSLVYKITGDKSQLEAVIKEINAKKPTIGTSVILDFDKSKFEKNLSRLTKYGGETATSIGKSISKNMNDALSDVDYNQIFKEMSTASRKSASNFTKIIKELESEITNFSFDGVVSLDDIDKQASAIQKLQTLQKQLPNTNYSKAEFGIDAKDLDKIAKKFYKDAGNYVKSNYSDMASSLTDQYEKEFGQIIALIENLNNSDMSGLSDGFKTATGDVDAFAKKIETAEKKVNRLKAMLSEFDEQSQIKSLNSSRDKINKLYDDGNFKDGDKATEQLLKDLKKYVSLGGDVKKLSSGFQEDFKEGMFSGYDNSFSLDSVKSAKDELLKAERELDSLRKKAQSAQSIDVSSESNSKEIQELSDLIYSLKKQLDEANTKYQEQINLVEKLNKEKSDLEANSIDTKSYDNVVEKLDNVNKKAESYKNMLDSANKSISELEKKFESLGNIPMSDSDTDELRTTVDKYQQQIDIVKKSLDEQISKNKALEIEVSTLQETQSMLNTQLKSQTEIVNQNKTYQEQLDENNKRIETLKNSLREKEKIIDSLNAKLQSTSNLIKDCSDKYNKFKGTPTEFDYLDMAKKKVAQMKYGAQYADKASAYYGLYVENGGKEKITNSNGVDISDKLLARYKELKKAQEDVANVPMLSTAQRNQLATLMAQQNEELENCLKINAELEKKIALQSKAISTSTSKAKGKIKTNSSTKKQVPNVDENFFTNDDWDEEEFNKLATAIFGNVDAHGNIEKKAKKTTTATKKTTSTAKPKSPNVSQVDTNNQLGEMEFSKAVTLNPELSKTFVDDANNKLKDVNISKEVTLSPELSETFVQDAETKLKEHIEDLSSEAGKESVVKHVKSFDESKLADYNSPIDSKTQAFKNEQSVVDEVTNKEVESLNKVKEAVLEIKNEVENLAEATKNIPPIEVEVKEEKKDETRISKSKNNTKTKSSKSDNSSLKEEAELQNDILEAQRQQILLELDIREAEYEAGLKEAKEVRKLEESNFKKKLSEINESYTKEFKLESQKIELLKKRYKYEDLINSSTDVSIDNKSKEVLDAEKNIKALQLEIEYIDEKIAKEREYRKENDLVDLNKHTELNDNLSILNKDYLNYISQVQTKKKISVKQDEEAVRLYQEQIDLLKQKADIVVSNANSESLSNEKDNLFKSLDDNSSTVNVSNVVSQLNQAEKEIDKLISDSEKFIAKLNNDFRLSGSNNINEQINTLKEIYKVKTELLKLDGLDNSKAIEVENLTALEEKLRLLREESKKYDVLYSKDERESLISSNTAESKNKYLKALESKSNKSYERELQYQTKKNELLKNQYEYETLIKNSNTDSTIEKSKETLNAEKNLEALKVEIAYIEEKIQKEREYRKENDLIDLNKHTKLNDNLSKLSKDYLNYISQIQTKKQINIKHDEEAIQLYREQIDLLKEKANLSIDELNSPTLADNKLNLFNKLDKDALTVTVGNVGSKIKSATNDIDKFISSSRDSFSADDNRNLNEQIKLIKEIYSVKSKLIGLKDSDINKKNNTQYLSTLQSELQLLQKEGKQYDVLYSKGERQQKIRSEIAKSQNNYLSKLNSDSTKISNIIDETNNRLNSISSTNGKVDTYGDYFNEVSNEIDRLNQKLQSDGIPYLIEYKTKINEIFKEANLSSWNDKGNIIGYSDNSNIDEFVDKYISSLGKVENLKRRYTQTGVDFVLQQRTEDDVINDVIISYDNLTKTFTKTIKSSEQGLSKFDSVLDSFKNKLIDVAKYLTSFVSVFAVWNTFKTGLSYAREFDDAIIELKAVVGSANADMSEFTENARKIADSLGSTTVEVIKSATDWRRLGYDVSNSMILARESSKLATTGFMDINTATEDLTSALQAFYSDADDIDAVASSIVDKFVNIGNEYAITTADLATSMTKASSSMVASGNDINEVIAMLTAGTTIMQDADVVANSIRVVGMRLRGTSEDELMNLGEDTDGLIEDASKLNDIIKSLTKTSSKPDGVSILTDTGAYKSTYQVLLEIAKVWEEIGDSEGGDLKQASLLESIAGKDRASAVSAILQNPKLLEDIYERTHTSSGTAQKVLDITLDSTSNKMVKLQNLWESLWQTDGVVNFQKAILNLSYTVLSFVKEIGVIPTLISAFAVSVATLNKFSTKFQGVVSAIGDGVNGFADLGRAVSSIGSLNISTGLLSIDELNSCVSAVKNLGDAEAVLAMKSKGMNSAQMAQVLSARELTDAQIAQALASKGLSSSIVTVTGAQSSQLVSSQLVSAETWNQAQSLLGLQTAENGLIVSTESLTYAQAQQALEEAGIVGLQQEAILSTLGLASAKGVESSATVALSGAKAQEVLTEALVTEEKQAEILASLGLVNADGALVASTEAVTFAKAQEALAEAGVTGVRQEAILGLLGYTTAQGVATTATGLFSSALLVLKGVMTAIANHPLLIAITALIGTFVVAKKVISEIIVTYDEHIEAVNKAKESYTEAKNALSEVTTQLQKVQRRIDELNSKASLTIVESEELENLKKTNKELERQARIKEALSLKAGEESAEEASDYFTDNSIKGEHWYSKKSSPVEYMKSSFEKMKDADEKIADALEVMEYYENIHVDDDYDLNTIPEYVSAQDQLKRSQEKKDKAINNADEYIGDIQAYAELLLDSNGNVRDGYYDLYESVQSVLEEYDELIATPEVEVANKKTLLKHLSRSNLAEDAINDFVESLSDEDISILINNVVVDEDTTIAELKGVLKKCKEEASKTNVTYTVKAILGNLNNEALDTYQSEMSSLQSYLEKLNDGSYTSSDLIDLAQEFDVVGSSVEEIKAGIGELLDTKLSKTLNMINQLITSTSNETTKEKLENLRKEIADIYAETKQPLKIGANVSGVNSLENVRNSMDALDNALASLTEGEYVTNFSDIVEKFGDLEGIEDFINTISNAKSVTNSTKEAFNELASQYITQSGILTNVTTANQNLIKSQLKEMGIANSSAVVQNQLTAEKEYLEQANKSLSESTVEEISLIMKEGEVSETTRKYLGAYLTAKINASDVWAVSTAEINALLNMASSAGIACTALEGLSRAKAMVGALETGNTSQVKKILISSGMENTATAYENGKISDAELLEGYSNYAENYIKNNADTISSEIQSIYANNKIDVSYVGGSSTRKAKDKGSKNKSDFEESIDYAEQSINVLEDKLTRLDTKLQTAKGWKAQRDILDEMLKMQEKLTAGYKKQENVYMNEYESSLKTLSKYVGSSGVAKARAKITSGEYFNIDKFIEKNISKDVDKSTTEKVYDALTDAITHYNNALTAGQNALSSANDEIANRKDKYQTYIDEATDNISKLEALESNTSSAEKKNYYEEKKLNWIKQQYSYQEKIYLLEGDTAKVSQNRAEQEAEILAIRQQQLENLSKQLDDERNLIELRANNLRDWGTTTATTAKNNKQNELIDNSISSINDAVNDYNTAKSNVTKSQSDVKSELSKAKGLTKKQISDIKSRISKKKRIGDDLLNAVLKSGNEKLYEYLNTYNTDIDYLEISKSNKNTVVEESKSDILDAHEQQIENISNKYETKRNAISDRTSVYSSQLETATNAKSSNKILKSLISEANKDLKTYRDELNEANGLYSESKSSILKNKSLKKAFTPEEIEKIKTCVKSGKTIPNSLLNKASSYPEIYEKLTSYNAYKVMVDEATTAYNQAEADNVNTVRDYKIQQNTNISDEKQALADLYKQLQTNATSYKKQNDYEKSRLSSLKASYEALLANALLEGNITEYKRLQAEYQKTASESALAQLENIEKYYGNRTSINSNKASLIKSDMDIAEAKGYQLTSEYYDKLIGLNKAEKTRLETKKAQMQTTLDEAVATNKIVVGSDDWYSALEKIYAVEESIQNATKTELDYLNKINELNWSNFDSLMKKISNITRESEFLLDLLSNDTLFDKSGNITSSGTATMGLHAQNYNTYMEQADEYAKKIEEVQAQLAKDPYNTTLTAKLQEYVEAQRDVIKNAESEKNAIVDLVKAGYDAQISAIEKLIDKQKGLLQAEKDRYSYQKNIANQEKNILKLQKQIEALSNSTDREDIAKRLKLEQELADALSELEDTQYEHSIETQEKAMDDALDSYKEQVENYLTDTKKVLSDALKYVNDNTSTILNSIQDKAQSVGTSISNNLVTVWGNAGNAVTEYSSTFSSAVTGITSAIESIKLAWEQALSAYTQYAKNTINSTVHDYTSIGSANNSGSSSIEAVNSSTDSKLSDILKIIGTSSSSNAEKNKGTSALNKYMKSIGFGQLSYQKMSDLYNILTGAKTTKDDFIGKSAIKNELLSYFQTWLKTNLNIVDSSFISKVGFATGGIGKLVKMSGEDGIAFVRNGEGFVSPEDVDNIKNLLDSVPLLSNLTDAVTARTVIPEYVNGNPNVSITAPLVNINGNLDNVTLDQLNKAIADVPRMLVKQMNKYGTR